MAPPTGENPGPGGPEAIYWRLHGTVTSAVTAALERRLEGVEQRIIERINKADDTTRRVDDQYRAVVDELRRQLRAVEDAMPDHCDSRLRDVEVLAGQARANARLLQFVVPLGFTAVALLIALLQYLHH